MLRGRSAWSLGIGRYCRRWWWQRRGLFLQLPEHVGDRRLELHVMSALPVRRRIIDGDIGFDSAVLDHPLRVESVERVLGNGDVAAVQKRPVAADAAHSTPGPWAKQRTEAVFAEVEREDVPVRGREVVDHADLRSVDELLRHGNSNGFAVGAHSDQHAPQTLEQHLVDVAAPVPALIDDQRLLVHLRIELTYELIQAEGGHV